MHSSSLCITQLMASLWPRMTSCSPRDHGNLIEFIYRKYHHFCISLPGPNFSVSPQKPFKGLKTGVMLQTQQQQLFCFHPLVGVKTFPELNKAALVIVYLIRFMFLVIYSSLELGGVLLHLKHALALQKRCLLGARLQKKSSGLN